MDPTSSNEAPKAVDALSDRIIQQDTELTIEQDKEAQNATTVSLPTIEAIAQQNIEIEEQREILHNHLLQPQSQADEELQALMEKIQTLVEKMLS